MCLVVGTATWIKEYEVSFIDRVNAAHNRMLDLANQFSTADEHDTALRLELAKQAIAASQESMALTLEQGERVDAHVEAMRETFVAVAKSYSDIAAAFVAPLTSSKP